MPTTTVYPDDLFTVIQAPVTVSSPPPPPVSPATAVEIDYDGSDVGFAYCQIQNPSAIDLSNPDLSITNIRMTITCSNDENVVDGGFQPVGQFRPLSLVTTDFSLSGNVGGFGLSYNGTGGVVNVGAAESPITYDFASMWAGGVGGIPNLTSWVLDAQNVSDPLCVVISTQDTFHSPGWLTYKCAESEWWFEIDWEIASSAAPVTVAPTFVTPSFAPTLRKYPRSDGLGASNARRAYPSSKSPQSSNRRAGGYL